jgi:ADP-ribose pyrophosphatase YjhB (NUDIX family)
MPGSHAATRKYGTGVGSLNGWRYCPRCSAELRRGDNRVECDACGFCEYANPVPATSAFVRDENRRVLLARRAYEPDAGKWDVPGGFLEEGEDPVAGLRRELREEAGVEVEVGDFVGVFVDGYGEPPDEKSVLNLVWEVRIVEGEPTPNDDVSELRWFPKDALPEDVEVAFRWLARGLRDWSARTP